MTLPTALDFHRLVQTRTFEGLENPPVRLDRLSSLPFYGDGMMEQEPDMGILRVPNVFDLRQKTVNEMRRAKVLLNKNKILPNLDGFFAALIDAQRILGFSNQYDVDELKFGFNQRLIGAKGNLPNSLGPTSTPGSVVHKPYKINLGEKPRFFIFSVVPVSVKDDPMFKFFGNPRECFSTQFFAASWSRPLGASQNRLTYFFPSLLPLQQDAVFAGFDPRLSVPNGKLKIRKIWHEDTLMTPFFHTGRSAYEMTVNRALIHRAFGSEPSDTEEPSPREFPQIESLYQFISGRRAQLRVNFEPGVDGQNPSIQFSSEGTYRTVMFEFCAA